MLKSTKVVIIHDDSQQLSVIDTLTNLKHRQTRQPFNYISFSNRREKKTFNIFECSECISHAFLSERNLVIITFNEQSMNDEKLKSSILRRLINVLTKNIIPINILILGLVQSGVESSKLIAKVQTYINEAINSHMVTLQSKIFIRKEENISFQAQKIIGNQINLLEQLQFIQNKIIIACLDINSRKGLLMYASDSDNSGDEYVAERKALEEANKALEKGQNAINSLSKSDVAETKSFAYPPKSVIQVSECVCLIFGMKPSYQYFKRFLSQNDVISVLKNYDPDSMSDYTFNELKKYIESSDFTPEQCSTSKFAANICTWIRGIHQWNDVQKKIEPIKDKIMNTSTAKPDTDVI